MMSKDRRNLLKMFAVAPFAGGLLTQASAQTFKPTKAMSSRDMIREHYFPNVVLTTHEGKKVRFYDDLLKDKIVILNFMYVKCKGICMPITMNLVKVQRLLGDRVGRDIFFYSITLKPEEDTPKALKEYAMMHRVGPGWLFLTGDPKDCEMLRRKLGFVDPNPQVDADTTRHIGNIRYGNEPLQMWAACPAQANAEWVAKSILGVDRPKAPQPKKAS